ncbi:MAG TPA: hypothetical protein VF708_08630 [Pyrinomonadaceae bacterium]|jgi:hypothetical protein
MPRVLHRDTQSTRNGNYVCRQVEDLLSAYSTFEQHKSRLIQGPFPALVRGLDVTGQKFETETILEHLSHSVFYLRLSKAVEADSRLFVITRVARAKIALLCVVRVIEPPAEGYYGLIADIKHCRFLPFTESPERDSVVQTQPQTDPRLENPKVRD